jgi:uncharacterized protein YwgA
MTRLQLAKLIQWAGTFRSRKRMQKVCFLLQTSGCPLEMEYHLDSIGPYSEDLARLTDEMTRIGLLQEEAEGHKFHQRFNYWLTRKAAKQLAEIEASRAPTELAELAPFELLFRQMLEKDVQDLENAATLVYLLQCGRERSQVVEQVCARKGWSKLPDGVLNITNRIMERVSPACASPR